MKREPKRTDMRDAERAIEPVLAGIERRREEDELDAELEQARLNNDPMAYALGDLLAGAPGVTVLDLETGARWPDPPRELPGNSGHPENQDDDGTDTVWVSTHSHRSRDKLRRAVGDPGPEYGVRRPGGWPRGSYYKVPAGHVPALRRIKGLRVLRGEPYGGSLFRRWTS